MQPITSTILVMLLGHDIACMHLLGAWRWKQPNGKENLFLCNTIYFPI